MRLFPLHLVRDGVRREARGPFTYHRPPKHPPQSTTLAMLIALRGLRPPSVVSGSKWDTKWGRKRKAPRPPYAQTPESG